MRNFFSRFMTGKNTRQHDYFGLSLSEQGMSYSHIQWLDKHSPPQLLSSGFIPNNQPDRFDKQALQDLVQQHHWQGLHCYISLSPRFYQLMLIDAPDVEQEQLSDAIKWRVKDLISEDIETVVVDAFRLAPDAYRGRMNMVYTAIIDKQRVKDLVKLIDSCQLQLMNIGIDELSACGYSHFIQAIDNAGIALVSLDKHEGMINLTENGMLYLTRSISVGSEDLLTAEPADVHHCDNETNALRVLPQKLEDLILDIQRSLDYYESQLGKEAIHHIFFLPTSNTDSIIDDLAQRLPCKVEQLQLPKIVQLNVATDDTTLASEPPSSEHSASISGVGVFSLGCVLAAAARDMNTTSASGQAHV